MRGLAPFWIDRRDKTLRFPNVQLALSEPDGLLAIGGDLSPQRLEAAYRHGVFPWFNHNQPILWWAPDPRTVLFPERLKISRSLRKTLRKCPFTLTIDHAFTDVIEACGSPRPGQRDDGPGTWITLEMKQAYQQLHTHGLAHSVECWRDGALVGGLYGVAIGRVFFGESMFSRCSDASKVALVGLVQQLTRWNFALIDCQIHSDHLASLGAETLPRERFTQLLEHYCDDPQQTGSWHLAELEAVVSESAT